MLGPRLSEEPYSGEDKRLLDFVANQAGTALENIGMAEQMAERLEAERRVEQEMDIARQVQSKLLPQKSPALQTLDYAGTCIQARAVGGDYYDFLDLGEGRVGLVLAGCAGAPAGWPSGAPLKCLSQRHQAAWEHRGLPEQEPRILPRGGLAPAPAGADRTAWFALLSSGPALGYSRGCPAARWNGGGQCAFEHRQR